MLVKETRPRTGGAFFGTESRVLELPDMDENQQPTPVPAGAIAVSGETPHDWQPDKPAGGK